MDIHHNPIIGECEACGEPIGMLYTGERCPKCTHILGTDSTSSSLAAKSGLKPVSNSPPQQTQHASVESPTISGVLTVIARLQLLGGLICLIAFWPSRAPYGDDLKAVAYVIPITWMMAGIVFWALFMAAAEGLKYLARIDAKLDRSR